MTDQQLEDGEDDDEIERLRAALKPFAEALTRAETSDPFNPDSRLIACREDLTLFEFAKARSALEQKPPEDEPSKVTVRRMRSEDWPDRQSEQGAPTCPECKDWLPSVNWKNGKAYRYCPECGREDHS